MRHSWHTITFGKVIDAYRIIFRWIELDSLLRGELATAAFCGHDLYGFQEDGCRSGVCNTKWLIGRRLGDEGDDVTCS